MGVSINLVVKRSFINLEMAQANTNVNDFQLIIHMSIKLTSTILECCVTFSGVKLSIRSFVLFIIESDLIIKIIKKFQ